MKREPDKQLSLVAAHSLPRKLYTADQVRTLDRMAIETIPVEGFELMKKAGRSAFRMLLRYWPGVKSLSVFCGGGNNGGDGFVVAGLAVQKGIATEVVLLADTDALSGEAASAWAWLKAVSEDTDLRVIHWQRSVEVSVEVKGEVVVDCLLGTGLTGDVRAGYAEAINAINQAEKPVLAVDTPSGLCSDTGRVLGCAVNACHTITFIGLKQGLLTGDAPNFVGDLEYDSLGVPEPILEQVEPSCVRADWWDLRERLPRRERCAHKGHFGRVLVIGGDRGMAGAALMAAEAVCRVGAGLVYVATRPEHVSAFIARCPELMVRGIDTAQQLETMLEMVDVIVVGPGLGQGVWGQQLFQKIMKVNKPTIVDADGLNMLAMQNLPPRNNWILTPHPGEAARLLNCTVTDIEQDRFKSVGELQKQYGGTVILKGSGTLIKAFSDKAEEPVWLANTGNPGMASGGMGDVLSGVLGGLLAQKGINSAAVAPIAVTLHGEAGNLASLKAGEYSLLASDVIKAIPQLLVDV